MEIYEDCITQETLQRVRADLADNDELRINSNGGDIFAAIAIHNLIKEKNITVRIDGLAASAASLIAVAGKRILMASNAQMMLHNPTVGLMGFFNKGDLERAAAGLAASESSILRSYAIRIPIETAKALLDRETWLGAEEALGFGLIDEITEPVFAEVTDSAEQIRAREVDRLLSIKKITDNAALIELAMKRGLTAAELKPCLAGGELKSLIADQSESGAAGVGGRPELDATAAFRRKVVDFANGVMK